MTEVATEVPNDGVDAARRACEPFLRRWGPSRLTRDAISETAIRRFCEVAEDANPVYWDTEAAAASRFGRVIAPPQSLFSMAFPGWWTPPAEQERLARDAAALDAADAAAGAGTGTGQDDPGRAVHAVCDRFGYVVNTVAGQEAEYVAPFGPGDGRIRSRAMTTDVSAEKRVRVGRGVFVTSITEYRTEVGDRLVGRSTLVLLRYRPEEDGDAG